MKGLFKRVIPPDMRRSLWEQRERLVVRLSRPYVRLMTGLTGNPDELMRYVFETQELTAEQVILALHQGIFACPWDMKSKLVWYDPDPRGILPIEGFTVPRTVRRAIRQRRFDISLDTAFGRAIRACAEPGPHRGPTFLHPPVIAVFEELHQMGLAHSVEVWQDGELIAGDIGVGLGSYYMGVSAFYRVPDASKVALTYLTEMLQAGGFVLHDLWWHNDYQLQYGGYEMPRAEFKQRLVHALLKPARLEPLSMDEFVQRVQQRREREVQAEQQAPA